MRTNVLRISVAAAMMLTVATLVFAPVRLALAADTADIGEMQTKIDPSVVTVKTDQGLGSGFVADAAGHIVTNYHVIEGAKKAAVQFPADKDKKLYRVEGFLAIAPQLDLALLKVDIGDKKLVPLAISGAIPARGAWIATFGSPLGLSLTAAEGKISAIRSGPELMELTKRGSKSVFEDLGFDPKSTWLQHTAPMSHGNSGGPLLNSRGEVVGINTWTLPEGQNLNFAISSPHIKDFVASAPKTPQPLSNLPEPREKGPTGPEKGDPLVTLKIWKRLNEATISLNKKVAVAEKSIDETPPPDPRMPPLYQKKWSKKAAKLYKDIAKGYTDHVAALRTLKTESADKELIVLVVEETNIFENLAAIYNSIGDDILRASQGVEVDTFRIKSLLAKFRTERDVVRINLSRRYAETYPTLEDTALANKAASGDEAKDAGTTDEGSNVKAKPVDATLSVLRTWTDSSGKHKVKARYRGMEGGKVKLEKTDGTLLRIAPDSLSERDRLFIGADE
jgi:S1-C subfamily serine protease